jgi:hypothetical protein
MVDSPPLLTPAEFQDMGNFFFKLSENKTAKTLATLAAIGAMLGGLHVLWLALLWIHGRM